MITTITTRINKEYETVLEMVMTILGSFAFLFLITFFSHIFPLNIILVLCFSAIVGWSLGPTITMLGKNFKFRRFLKNQGIKTKKDADDNKKTIYYTESKQENGEFNQDIINQERINELQTSFYKKLERGGDPYNKQWQNIVFQAMLGTTLSVFATACIVFLSDVNFSFLGVFLFIALSMLIVMTILNTLFFKSKIISLLKAYFGVIIFILYLLYDFNRLEELINQGDTSWSTAIDIAVNLYLDIINLFLDLLEILASE